MSEFVTGGPPRFAHQRRALNKMISTGGVTALLLDPGLGKTACVLDYASLLALKSRRREARVLVVCPLVAIDTWVLQTRKFISPMVDYWAEALGGSMLQRAEALASRGEAAYRTPLGVPSRIPSDPPEPEEGTPEHAGWEKTVARNSSIRSAHARYAKAVASAHPRALHSDRSYAWAASDRTPRVTRTEGPGFVGDRPRVVLEVVNIDSLSRRDTVGSKTMADVMVDAINRFDPDLVVVDESHKIKGSSANASKLLARVSKNVKRRMILTGTVMPHSPLDVFAQWRFLDPYAFGDPQPDGSVRQATFNGFKSRYAVLGGWMGKEVISFRNLDEMQKIMARNAIVVRKEEALDLPTTTDVEIPVELSVAEKKAYKDMKDGLATLLSSGGVSSVPNLLSQMMRLRQITSGHLPDDSGQMHVVGNSKVNTIRSLVQDTLAGEKRIVVFALFSVEIDMLRDALAEKGTEVMTITGATSTKERERLRQRFGSNAPQRMVMVAQIKTMSVAVNELVTANHAIFASLSYQRDDLIQARDRLDRIGQTRPVTFWYALAPGTVDEVILKSHRERTDLENAMLRHIQQDSGA